MPNKPTHRKTILLYQILASDTFTKTINLDFIPDEMILRSVNYCFTVTEGAVAILKSSIIDMQPLLSFKDECYYSPNTVFPLKKPINGDYNFSVANGDDTIDATRQGTLTFTLEFVKY